MATPLITQSKLWISLSAIVIASFMASSDLQAQVVGDRVVVTATSETKIHKEVVDRVFAGGIHTVIAVNEDWCALNDVRGWLPLQRVMNLEMAKEHYDERIDDNDEDWDAYATRGMIYREFDKLPRAFTDLNKSLRINPKNANTWNNRGVVLNAQGQYELALKDIKYALKLNDKYPNGYFNLGTVYYAMNRHREAVAAFDKAIELKNKNAWYYISRGSAKHSMGDEDGALQDYETSIQLDKRMADAYIGISNVHLGREDLENAMKYVEQALTVQPRNAMALNARGWVHYKMRKFSDALLDYNQSIRYAPKMPVSYNNRGVCYAALEDYEKAVADYSRSLELVSYSPITYSNRGTALFNSGEFVKAKEDFEKALETGQNLAEPMNSIAWFRSVCPEDEFRDGDSAVEIARKACELTEWKDWTIVDTLAAACAEASDFGEAQKWATKALELAPEDRKVICRERLALFESEKPFRSSTGKTSDPEQQTRRHPAPEETPAPTLAEGDDDGDTETERLDQPETKEEASVAQGEDEKKDGE